MVYWGKGGWTFSDIYEMPVFLRKMYFRKMTEAVEEQAKHSTR
jgi:hypothetical protein